MFQEIDVIRLFYPQEDASHLDDCAEIPVQGSGVSLVTTDSMTEGTHFRLDWSSPEDLARKLFHSNLSDLAASGARGTWALLTLGIPPHIGMDFLKSFADTLLSCLKRHGVRLIGGDSYRSVKLDLGMTMAGRAGRRLERAGGRAGDALYVTGELGLSLAGFRSLSGTLALPADLDARARKKHLAPESRAEWGVLLADEGRVHACMDISDGLVEDAPRLAGASGLSLEIDLEDIPVPGGLSTFLPPEQVAQSGEEYELLFLGDPGLTFSFPVTVIGRAVALGQSPVAFRHSGVETILQF
ncbi:MAG: thiamine-phosphate kinase [Spirochaetia bacterium]|nr:thiamine-phosphate kinase [Spirochaetia bacterium]